VRPQLFVVSYIFWPIKIVFSVVYFQFNVARKLSTASKEAEFCFRLLLLFSFSQWKKSKLAVSIAQGESQATSSPGLFPKKMGGAARYHFLRGKPWGRG